MTPIKSSIIAVFSLILLAPEVRAAKRVTIDAATRYNAPDYLLLMAGGETLIVNSENQESDKGTLADFEIPKCMFVKSAFTTSPKSSDVVFYGAKYGHRINMRSRKTKRLKYRKREFFQKGGPDAAARKGKETYLFRDCDMVRRPSEGSWGDLQSVTEIGLPCNVDAAWNIEDGNTMVLLKGDQIWLWGKDGEVSEPRDFSSMYTITSWELIPRDET